MKKRINRNSIGIFVLSILLILFITPWSTGSFFDRMSKGYDFQILFAILTALITTIIFNLYGYITNWLNTKKYIGFWYVLEFDGADYNPTKAFVEINRDADETLKYSYTDLNNLNNKIGTIYINKNNKKTGKLISGFDFLNQVAKLYPIVESSVFFDTNIYKPEKPVPIIRIIDLKGNEKFCLERPQDQKAYKANVMNLYNETAFNKAGTLSVETLNKLTKHSC